MGKLISNKEFKKLYGKVIHEGTDCIETDKGFVIYKAPQKTTTKKQTKGKTMENEYAKNLTIKNTETNTKWMLYYMGKATDAIRKGESPVRWLCAAVEYGADLKTNYAQAENLEIWGSMDFVEIYEKALEQAKQEIEND